MRAAERTHGRRGEGFLRFAVGFYLLSVALGVFLRAFFVAPFAYPVFGNAVHAHSHTLYFGWGALGVFALALERGRFERILLGGIVAISAATFVSFFHGGYWTPSIVISALSLLLWPTGAVLVSKRLRGERSLSATYLRAAMAYVLLASVAAAVRAVFVAIDASPLAKSLAVFAFLHDFAWFFVFALLGLLLRAAPGLGLRIDERLLAWHASLAIPLAWLGFPLGVHQGHEGLLGALARISTLVLVVPGALAAAALWKAGRGGRDGPHLVFRWLALWFALDALLAGLGAAGLAETALRSRHLAILYLHVRLLGFFTLGLMLCLFARCGRIARFAPGMWLHNFGLTTMLGGLAVAGLPGLGWTAPSTWLQAALFVAALGGAIAAAAGVLWFVRLFPSPRAGDDAALGAAR